MDRTGAINSLFTTLGSGMSVSARVPRVHCPDSIERLLFFRTFVLNWSGSAMRPKEKHIPSLLFLFTPQCPKDHNIATVECTGDQYN